MADSTEAAGQDLIRDAIENRFGAMPESIAGAYAAVKEGDVAAAGKALGIGRGPLAIFGILAIARTFVHWTGWGKKPFEHYSLMAAQRTAQLINDQVLPKLHIENKIEDGQVKQAMEFGLMALGSHHLEHAIEGAVTSNLKPIMAIPLVGPLLEQAGLVKAGSKNTLQFSIPNGYGPIVLLAGSIINILGDKLPDAVKAIAENKFMDKVLRILPGYDPAARMSAERVQEISKTAFSGDVGKVLQVIESKDYTPEQLKAASDALQKDGKWKDTEQSAAVLTVVRSMDELQKTMRSASTGSAQEQTGAFISWMEKNIAGLPAAQIHRVLEVSSTVAEDLLIAKNVRAFMEECAEVYAIKDKKQFATAKDKLLAAHEDLLTESSLNALVGLLDVYGRAQSVDLVEEKDATTSKAAGTKKSGDVNVKKESRRASASPTEAALNGEVLLKVPTLAIEAIEKYSLEDVVAAAASAQGRAAMSNRPLSPDPECDALIKLLVAVSDNSDPGPQVRAIMAFAETTQNQHFFPGNVGRVIAAVGNAMQDSLASGLKEKVQAAVDAAPEDPNKALGLLKEIGKGPLASSVIATKPWISPSPADGSWVAATSASGNMDPSKIILN